MGRKKEQKNREKDLTQRALRKIGGHGGGGAVVLGPILDGCFWRAGGSEEHRQECLCHGKQKPKSLRGSPERQTALCGLGAGLGCGFGAGWGLPGVGYYFVVFEEVGGDADLASADEALVIFFELIGEVAVVGGEAEGGVEA